MRGARRPVASSLMLLLLFVQTGTASPLASCSSAVGGQGMHDHDTVTSAEHPGVTVTDREPVPQNRSPVPESCAAAAHCALNLPAAVSSGPEVQEHVQALEETASSWFLHLAPLTHGTPPPRA